MTPKGPETVPKTAVSTARLGEIAGELRVAIMRTARLLRTEGSGDSVTPSQYSVLAALRSSPATLRELAESERVRPPSMTRTVDMLCGMGLATRTADPSDGRQVVVSLAPAGRALLNETRNRRTEWLSRRLADLEPGERDVIAHAAEILKRMSAV